MIGIAEGGFAFLKLFFILAKNNLICGTVIEERSQLANSPTQGIFLDDRFVDLTLDLRKEKWSFLNACNGIFHSCVLNYCWHDDEFSHCMVFVFVCTFAVHS